MANDTTEPGAPKDTGRRRKAPTIEGTATEIAVTTVAEDPSPAPNTAPEAADIADQIAIPKDTDEARAPADEAAAVGPVPDEPVTGDRPPDEPPVGMPDQPAAAGSSAWRAMIAGGVAAVVVVALAGAAAYALRPRDSTPEILARLSGAEAKIADLAGRPASAATPETIADITARIGQIEAKTAAPATGVGGDIPADRLAAAETATRTLAERNDALARRAEEARASLAALDQRLAATQASLADIARTDPAKIAAVETRVTAAEAAVKETRAALAAVTEPPHLKAVRLAVLAQALEAAVARGAPYAETLAAVRALSPDEAIVAALTPFAASGLPSAQALAAELAPLAPRLHAAAAPQDSDQSILAKFAANAEKIVRVRPAGDATGDDAGAVIARMEMKAGRGDLAGSLAEAQKLPAEARALADPWIKRVSAREQARAAATKLHAAALAAVATDKGPAR